jgi:hypothetical protein
MENDITLPIKSQNGNDNHGYTSQFLHNNTQDKSQVMPGVQITEIDSKKDWQNSNVDKSIDKNINLNQNQSDFGSKAIVRTILEPNSSYSIFLNLNSNMKTYRSYVIKLLSFAIKYVNLRKKN